MTKALTHDRIRGCLYGGAVGDALGYPVEFLSEEGIRARYGGGGIKAFDTSGSGVARISDDTQMTLFTANGMLLWMTAGNMAPIRGLPRFYLARAYEDWYKTQTRSFADLAQTDRGSQEGGWCWLLDLAQLFSCRAPGNTCMTYLADGVPQQDDFLTHPRNDSKGCGGIMRVAPVGLVAWRRPADLAREAAQAAALTHGHPLGWMPSAFLALMVHKLVFAKDPVTLQEAALYARSHTADCFAGQPDLPVLLNLVDQAMEAAGSQTDDLTAIHSLGQGWVAEEALAIALYCVLRYPDDFSAAVTAAVNHQGDSDSTGSLAGALWGAAHGYKAIPEAWKDKLELEDTILELADDLARGCPISERSARRDPAWEAKYLHYHSYDRYRAPEEM